MQTRWGVGQWRAGQHGGDDVGVGEHIVGAEWMWAGQAELVEELPAEGWLQWWGKGCPVGLEVERIIEAVDIGVAVAFGGEAFHLYQGEAIRAVLLGDLALEGDGGADPAPVRRGRQGGGAWCGCGCPASRGIRGSGCGDGLRRWRGSSAGRSALKINSYAKGRPYKKGSRRSAVSLE